MRMLQRSTQHPSKDVATIDRESVHTYARTLEQTHKQTWTHQHTTDKSAGLTHCDTCIHTHTHTHTHTHIHVYSFSTTPPPFIHTHVCTQTDRQIDTDTGTDTDTHTDVDTDKAIDTDADTDTDTDTDTAYTNGDRHREGHIAITK